MSGREKRVIDEEFCKEVINCEHIEDCFQIHTTGVYRKECAYVRYIKRKNKQEEILTQDEVEHLLGGLEPKDKLKDVLIELHEIITEVVSKEENTIKTINLTVLCMGYRTEIIMKVPQSLNPDELTVYYNIE